MGETGLKRDMDLIRQILLRIESWDQWLQSGFDMCGYEKNIVDYNLVLLISRGLVDGHVNRSIKGNPHLIVGQLTWEGQDFLDAIRSDSIWQKTKDHMKSKNLQSVPYEILNKVAMDQINDLLSILG